MTRIGTQKIHSIQVLRAIAVMVVVHVHSIDSSLYLSQKRDFDHVARQVSWGYLENWGAIGVDLFFVVSGFIMTRVVKSYLTGAKGWQDFALRRVIRIAPLYWLVTLAYLPMHLQDQPLSWQEVVKTIIFLPLFDSLTSTKPIIYVGWTLSFEIYFYLIIALLLRLSSQSLLVKTTVLLVALSLLGFLTNFAAPLPHFLTNPLLLEFAYGLFIGILYDRIYAPTRAGAVLAMLVFGLGVLTMNGSIWTGYNAISEVDTILGNNSMALYRALIWGFPCALLTAGYLFVEKLLPLGKVHIRLIKPLELIGDASFSCYLIHLRLLGYLSGIGPKLGIKNPDLYIAFCMVSCLICSILMYRYVEKLLISFINRLVFAPIKREVSV